MKYLTLIFGMLFLNVLGADGHLQDEQDVLGSLQNYFEASSDFTWKVNQPLWFSSHYIFVEGFVHFY